MMTPRPWKLWRLADDVKTYGDKAGKLILVTEDGEEEVCGPFWNDEDAEFVLRLVEQSRGEQLSSTLPVLYSTTPYDGYEIARVMEKDGQCEVMHGFEVDEPGRMGSTVFWSIYGHIPDQGVECISDFNSQRAACEMLSRITGTFVEGGEWVWKAFKRNGKAR